MTNEPGKEQDQIHAKRGDGINVTRAEVLASIGAYDAKAQDDLLWLYGYCVDRLHGSRSALVDFIGKDWTTIWRIWMGKYGADITQYLERVRHFRRKAERTDKTGFVTTVVTERIFKVCDVARDNGSIVMISGPSGRSKTHSVKEWQRLNNHGRSIYVYAPETGGFSGFIKALAKAIGASENRNSPALANTIENSLDYRNVLIVDEMAHLLPGGRTSGIAAIEFIRGLHDRTKCGVIMVCTEIFPQQMAGGKWSQWFEQLQGRMELHLRIPQEFSRREIADICAAYTADPEPEMIKLAREIANKRKGGVRELFRHLNRASDVAGKLGQPVNAKHLAGAWEFAQNLLTIPE